MTIPNDTKNSFFFSLFLFIFDFAKCQVLAFLMLISRFILQRNRFPSSGCPCQVPNIGRVQWRNQKVLDSPLTGLTTTSTEWAGVSFPLSPFPKFPIYRRHRWGSIEEKWGKSGRFYRINLSRFLHWIWNYSFYNESKIKGKLFSSPFRTVDLRFFNTLYFLQYRSSL